MGQKSSSLEYVSLGGVSTETIFADVAKIYKISEAIDKVHDVVKGCLLAVRIETKHSAQLANLLDVQKKQPHTVSNCLLVAYYSLLLAKKEKAIQLYKICLQMPDRSHELGGPMEYLESIMTDFDKAIAVNEVELAKSRSDAVDAMIWARLFELYRQYPEKIAKEKIAQTQITVAFNKKARRWSKEKLSTR